MTKDELLQIPFYIEDISGSENTVSITKGGSSARTLNLEYSTDGSEWITTTMNSGTTANTFTIPANGKLYFRGVNNYWGQKYNYSPVHGKCNIITCSGNHNVGGNIMSLLYGSEFKDKTEFPTNGGYEFYYLFTNNTTLVNAQDLQLPATTLTSYCYQSMFSSCSSLTTAPELPATTLATYCYRYMFSSCTSLTKAPELPATTLADRCYYSMFSDCTSLTTAPSILPATTLANSCYASMFSGCSSLTIAPELPATTLADYCYYYMFYGCSSLTTAPELPATELVNGCYFTMFTNCEKLNYINAQFTNYTYNDNTSTQPSLFNWVSGVSSTGTFVMNPNANYYPEDVRGVNGIPTGWTVLTRDANATSETVEE